MKLEVTVSGSCLVWPTVGEGFYKILSPPPREFYLLLTFSLTFPWKPDNNNCVITRYNLRQKYPLMENCVWTRRINYMRGSRSFGLTWKQWLLKKKYVLCRDPGSYAYVVVIKNFGSCGAWGSQAQEDSTCTPCGLILHWNPGKLKRRAHRWLCGLLCGLLF